MRRHAGHLCSVAAVVAVVLSPLALISSGTSAAQDPIAVPSQLARGTFLVAGRSLLDPNFSETVVLLLEYGPEGALGVVVNRPTTVKLADLLPGVKGGGERTDPVYIGGPVLQNHMLMLLRSDSAPDGSERVLEEVYYSSSQELLRELLGRGESAARLRIFAGHAGWAPGQLEWEVGRKSWHIVEADADAVFGDHPDELWDEMIRRGSGLLARYETSPGRLGVRVRHRSGSLEAAP